MLAYGVLVGDPQKFEATGRRGLDRVAQPADEVVVLRGAPTIAGAYNRILDAVAQREDLEGVVLLHEDAEIVDDGFAAVLRRRFADDDVAIVGVIGATGVTGLDWWEGDVRGSVVETRGRVGTAGGGHDVEMVDGLLLALSPWASRHLRFDEELPAPFHGYDFDICFQARARGRRVVVDDLPVVHHTKGGWGDLRAWTRADRAVRAKWLDESLVQRLRRDLELAKLLVRRPDVSRL